jgi:predicted transcriptional regulator
MWTFLTNHAHVLLCLVRDPEMRMRDIADVVGITERGVQKIVADLATEGYLQREREGRCNKYRIDTSRPLRHPIERHRSIDDLIGLVVGVKQDSSRPDEVAK